MAMNLDLFSSRRQSTQFFAVRLRPSGPEQFGRLERQLGAQR